MQGDFEAFYLRHFKAIYRVCYAFMKNAADAEDCTEDAFVKAMSCDISFENERHERSWLTTTAMNICKDKLKHWWRQKVTDLDEEAEQIAAEPDEKSEVVEAVMALPVKYKEVVWLHYYEGYQTDEIAFLYDCCTAAKPGLTQTIPYDRRVLDTLPEQTVDDAGVATELCGIVFSAF